MCFVLFAYCAWAALLVGIAKTATGKACNECKTLVRFEWSVFECSDTTVVFQTAICLILVERNNKRSSALTAKPATALPEFVCIIVTLSYVFASSCSLNRMNL